MGIKERMKRFGAQKTRKEMHIGKWNLYHIHWEVKVSYIVGQILISISKFRRFTLLECAHEGNDFHMYSSIQSSTNIIPSRRTHIMLFTNWACICTWGHLLAFSMHWSVQAREVVYKRLHSVEQPQRVLSKRCFDRKEKVRVSVLTSVACNVPFWKSGTKPCRVIDVPNFSSNK